MAETGAPAKGSMWTRKTGPLALWQWMAIVLGLAIGYSMYRSKKAAAAASSSSTDNSTAVPADQVPSVIQENFGSPIITPPANQGPTPPVTAPPNVHPINGGSPPKGPTPPVAVIPPKPTPTPAPKPVTPKPAKTKTYTIKSGDTMIGIASKQFGLPATEAGADKLYAFGNNSKIIQTAAKSHGYNGPDYVAHIYPGTVLTGPAS